MLFVFWFGFVIGVVALLGLEFWIFLVVVDRLRRKSAEPEASGDDRTARDLDGDQSLASALSKQGIVWILEAEKVPKLTIDESPTKGPKEPMNKKIIQEVYPIKKYAKIKDRNLILSDADGSQRTIELLDCTIVAVSASDLSSRKCCLFHHDMEYDALTILGSRKSPNRAKRYPVKLESKNLVLYNGSKTCYIYFETSWEKESWCKALRLASCPDRKKLKWFTQLSGEFNNYLTSVTAEYPSFLKPSEMFGEALDTMDTTSRIDVSSSKVRGFLKKLARKASKNGVESKSALISSSIHGERRTSEKIRSLPAISSIDDSVKCSSENLSSNSLQDLMQTGSPTSSKSSLQIIPDSGCSEKILNDGEGTLCWNLLFSRLFFDAKRSIELNAAIKTRIQRTLSNMRTPGYIGGVTCTGLDLGNLPPFIHKMRVLPVDLSEIWAVEVDIEYSGGIVLEVETRIEVCEHELQKEDLNKSLGLSPAGAREVTSDLLEGIDYLGNQLGFPNTSANQMENRDEGGDRVDGLKQSKNTKWGVNYASRWKAAVHSIANKVAQVPISLAIRIASLRGTLRLHIKSPPSDRIWFGFTSMPEIEWNLDSSVGDQKITNSHVALLIGNRFKASIRDTLVLPNCESICIPWMSAEKDDWVPRNVAPFIWINQDAMDMTGLDSTSSQGGVAKAVLDGSTRSKTDAISYPDDNVEKIKNVVHIPEPSEKSETEATGSQNASIRSVSINQSVDTSKNEELREPLLRSDEIQEDHCQSRGESPKTSSASSENLILDQPTILSEEDVKPKRMSSRRARMMDLGKKMGEKLEEKRRLIEERSRHVVEKMRENART